MPDHSPEAISDYPKDLPEPWTVETGRDSAFRAWAVIWAANKLPVVRIATRQEDISKVTNVMERIVACVNFCKGVPQSVIDAFGPIAAMQEKFGEGMGIPEEEDECAETPR